VINKIPSYEFVQISTSHYDAMEVPRKIIRAKITRNAIVGIFSSANSSMNQNSKIGEWQCADEVVMNGNRGEGEITIEFSELVGFRPEARQFKLKLS
jgi:hypothetical protein